jgi:hypothetical protein
MSLLNTPNVVIPSVQTASYAVLGSQDIVPFLVTGVVTATLPTLQPAAGLISSVRSGGQGIVAIKNSASSTANVLIAAGSGDAIFGSTAAAPGQMIICQYDGMGTWYNSPIGGTSGSGQLVRVQQTCAVTAFTDGGSTSGTLVLANTIPAGAVYARTLFSNLVGFAGDVSATATLGDGSDVDRYNTGTPNFFTTAAQGVDAGVPSGTLFHNAAIATVTLTVTTNSDFTLCKTNAAGSVLVTQFYYNPY